MVGHCISIYTLWLPAYPKPSSFLAPCHDIKLVWGLGTRLHAWCLGTRLHAWCLEAGAI